MAGCTPAMFSIVLAGAECFLDLQYGLVGTLSATAGCSQYLVVNGPARDEAGVDYKHGVLGAGHRANAAIGRALKLLVTNRGEGKLGGTDSTTVGNSSKYGLCFGEWEERASGRLHMHAENGWGFEKEDPVATAS